MFVLLAVVACSKSDDTKPSSAADPWGTPSGAPATADDPWAAKSAPAGDPPEPPPPPPQAAADGASTLAGSYQCQQLRYGTSVNGIRQSTYVSSALGVFEVDGDGTYRSSSYPGKGTGRVRADPTNVTFEGGPYAGSVGQAGTISSGSFYIRFSENLTDAPAPSMRFNDHMCYRK
jgi:hypothetical protein